MSFGSALALGIGLGHTLPRQPSITKYNGKGFAGDQEAIAEDFNMAVQKADKLVKK